MTKVEGRGLIESPFMSSRNFFWFMPSGVKGSLSVFTHLQSDKSTSVFYNQGKMPVAILESLDCDK